MATANLGHIALAQPEINVALAPVGVLTPMSLDGGSAALGLVIRGEDITMDPGPERFAQHQAFSGGVLLDSMNQVISIHGPYQP